MNELFAIGYSIVAILVIVLCIASIFAINKIAEESIKSGESRQDEYEKIFVPVGICGTWLIVKKK